MRSDPQVGGHCDDCPCAYAYAIDCGDNGLAAVHDGFDQIAGHAGEGQKLFHGHFGQGADDVVHIAARAEVASV